MAKISKELTKLLDIIHPEGDKRRAAHTQTLYDLLEPVHDAVEHVQIVVTRVLRAKKRAFVAEIPQRERHRLERVNTTCLGLLREIQALSRHCDDAMQAAHQLDTEAIDIRRAMEAAPEGADELPMIISNQGA